MKCEMERASIIHVEMQALKLSIHGEKHMKTRSLFTELEGSRLRSQKQTTGQYSALLHLSLTSFYHITSSSSLKNCPVYAKTSPEVFRPQL